MLDTRQKEIEKAFENRGDDYLLDFEFWQNLKAYPEIVDHIFNYVDQKIDANKRDETLVKLLKNTSKFDFTLKTLKINDFNDAEKIYVLFENFEWVMRMIAVDKKQAEKFEIEKQSNPNIRRRPETFIHPIACIDYAQALQDSFSYLESQCLLSDDRVLNLAANVRNLDNIRNDIMSKTIFAHQTEKYLHLIYENWSHPLMYLLRSMMEFNLLTPENLDALFSKDLKKLSCLAEYRLFKLVRTFSAEDGYPLNQKIFDVFLNNWDHMDKVKDAFESMTALDHNCEFVKKYNFDKIFSEENTALIFECGKEAFAVMEILEHCYLNGIHLTQENMNILKENKNYLQHVADALKPIKSTNEVAGCLRQTQENANYLTERKSDFKKMFEDMLVLPKEAKIIAYKFQQKHAPKPGEEIKNAFRDKYQSGRLWGEMWRNWNMVNVEGKEVPQPPVDVMEKIISEHGKDKIDETTNSAITQKCLNKS